MQLIKKNWKVLFILYKCSNPLFSLFLATLLPIIASSSLRFRRDDKIYFPDSDYDDNDGPNSFVQTKLGQSNFDQGNFGQGNTASDAQGNFNQGNFGQQNTAPAQTNFNQQQSSFNQGNFGQDNFGQGNFNQGNVGQPNTNQGNFGQFQQQNRAGALTPRNYIFVLYKTFT